jgi:hypothetical protein
MVRHYDGPLPNRYLETVKSNWLPLGSLEDVQQCVSEGLPSIEWGETPSLVDQLREAGLGRNDDGQGAILKRFDKPWVVGHFAGEDFFLVLDTFFGETIDGFFVEVHGTGDPLPALAGLCRAGGWCLVETTEDGECFDFSDIGQARLVERREEEIRKSEECNDFSNIGQAQLVERREEEIPKAEPAALRPDQVRSLRRQANAQAGLYAGEPCPGCGFYYGWDGLTCDHCHLGRL